MNAVNKYSRFVIVAVLLLVASQLVYAQENEGTPQWVIDRQMYETTFVYTPNVQPAVVAPKIPQWVIDRQMYETTFVYRPSDFPTTTVVVNP